ncbi:uncharacterized protein Triagg1_5859 [Trichoderma aggressivum f. europaeum]|uniref:Uncharacterized protein n=1 Tax=Trichoderma aggressivum f. europaeum TaxID=173218 RepID=A0AAE1LZV5_9HYPO|nr:hypothetical protein Triagg1_5859 [Trichoderma aggressivum f. europaeum]
MFRSRIRSRLLERYERQVCEKLCRRTTNGSERSFVLPHASTRGYATGKGSASADASRAVNKAAPGSASSLRISSTTTTGIEVGTGTGTGTGAGAASSAAALRTAEARDSALRAARMRRLAQQQDRLEEEAKKKEAKREYKRRYDTAARKWVSTIIALPILLVTSYYLFDRLALRNEPKSLEKYRGEKK